MNNDDFQTLRLKSLCPHADDWPIEYMHQKMLVAAAKEVRAFLRDADAKFDAIDANRDLSPEGKQRQRVELATEFIGKLEGSAALTRAQEAAKSAHDKYQAKIDTNLTPATDPQAVGVHAQIRGQLLALKDPKERMNFLGRNGNDLTLISAVLSAPAYVSGITEAEAALLRRNLERHAPPEIIKERDFVHSALAEIERGCRAARARIAKRGGLEKSPNSPSGGLQMPSSDAA